MAWLINGAPSPIHWLMLAFAIGGTVVVITSFISDMFTGPKPPPRSYYEATLWRGKRQVHQHTRAPAPPAPSSLRPPHT